MILQNNLKEFSIDITSTPQITNIIALDLVDACNLSCPSCKRGQRFMKNSKKQMEFNLFRQIIDKASRLGLTHIGLFNWTEPFLAKKLYNYTEYIKQNNLSCSLSTNFSLPNIDSLEKTLSNVDSLIISLSGFTQDIYSIHHKGGNINFVKKNIIKVSELLQNKIISTDVCIRYFMFEHSKHEYFLFKEFADKLNIKIIPWRGENDPQPPQRPVCERNELMWLKDHSNIEKLIYSKNIYNLDSGKLCRRSITPISIDYKGDVFLCCAYPLFDSTYVGNFLSDDFDVIQYRRSVHPLCNTCLQRDIVPFIDPLYYHKMTILRGIVKNFNMSNVSLFSFCDELIASKLCTGRFVYFYGYGDMFKRKRHVFSECKPIYILADTKSRPKYIDGLEVRYADDELSKSIQVPIIIFAGHDNQNIIIEKLKKYRHISEIYCCSPF